MADYIRIATGEMGFRGQFARQQSETLDVRFGSKADIDACPSDVRVTPKSGHRLSALGCPPGTIASYRPQISFSHGAEWKALISRYIRIIPLSGDACCMAAQRISGSPPLKAVSSAIMAKVGVAARHSQSAATWAADPRSFPNACFVSAGRDVMKM